MKTLIPATASGFLYFVPLFVFAQTTVESGEISGYAGSVIDFINDVLIPLILAIAFLVFIWGVFKFFIVGASDEEERGKGKQLMIWGIVGFVVIITIVGIVTLLAEATGLSGSGAGNLKTPTIPGI